MGEIAGWLNDTFKIGASLTVKKMQVRAGILATECLAALSALVNPSPNASSVNMARLFPGTVLLEGTILSEGRGTTTPLELLGAPKLDVATLTETLNSDGGFALGGTLLRPCFFEPTFHKHAGTLCSGIQFHTEHPNYRPERHLPYTLMAIALRSIQRQLDSSIWRSHEYEYERGRLPIDVISGGSDSVNGSTAPMPLSHHCAAGVRKTEATGLARENIITCIKRRNLNHSLWTSIPEVLLVNGRED